jgi:hypothetical protein
MKVYSKRIYYKRSNHERAVFDDGRLELIRKWGKMDGMKIKREPSR